MFCSDILDAITKDFFARKQHTPDETMHVEDIQVLRKKIMIREVFKNPSNGNFPLRGGGVPPFSVNFFPLTFWENVVRDGPGGGGTPLTDNFRDWGY